MHDNLIKEFLVRTTKENEERINAEKRKKHFREIGRKGGLKTKMNMQLSKVISFRLTDFEYEESQKESQKYNLKLSTYSRMRYLGKRLKIKEFESNELLLGYGNNFVRITNLLRNREWNIFDNKKQILEEINEILDLIRQYLYSKTKQKNE